MGGCAGATHPWLDRQGLFYWLTKPNRLGFVKERTVCSWASAQSS
jgi:hypothetical protein